MDGFETKLGVLSDSLDKKLELLRQILTITENQEAILISELTAAEDDLAALNAMFLQMNDERQKLIDELLNSDRLFERVFKEISDEFETRAPDYKPVVAKLQDSIREATDLDVKIRLQEKKNRQTLQSVDADIRPQKTGVDFTKASREYVLKQYEKNNEREES